MAGKVSSDPNIFLLPDIGEGLQEAELIKWLVKEGDTVEEQQALAEVETDKALTEIPSPRAGTIKTLHGDDGDTMKVGEPFVSFEGVGGGSSAPEPTADNGTAAAAEGAREDDGTVVGKMSADTPGLTRQAGKALATPAVRRKAREMGVDINAVPGSGIGGRVLEKDLVAFAGSAGATAKPAAPAAKPAPAATPAPATTLRPMPRPAAPQPQYQPQPMPQMQQQPMPQYQPQQMGYGMPQMGMPQMGMPMPMMMMPVPMMMPYGMPGMGGGSAGVPLAPGYVPASARPIPDPAQQSLASAGDASTPFKGVRKTIANRLRQSVDTAVHFTVMDEADVTDLDALRRQFAEAGTKLSFLPFVASAVCKTMAPRAGGRFGALNARVEGSGDDQTIVEHHAVHLGIATDTDAGLMVPVIRDADAMDAVGLSDAIANAANGARTRTAAREDLSGSTFTISNVGSHAGMFATPVINAPEVGILAVGKVYDAVVVRDGQAVVGKKMPLSLACDHRVVDGATAALALAEIVKMLQEPASIA